MGFALLPLFLFFELAYCANTNGTVDLTEDTSNGPGIGFTFSDSISMQNAKEFLSKTLPHCKQGPVDSIYFYLYDCEVPSESVLQMASTVGEGFLFASDKSITTMTDLDQSSLLLANAWEMTLHYSSSGSCAKDWNIVQDSSGCVSNNQCSRSKRITVGCGSLSCSGCEMKGFFSEFGFENAKFELQ